MTEHYKQSRTFHLPCSPGLQNDDRRLEDEFCFSDKTVAVLEKRDGEGSSIYNNGYHARSLSSVDHPSRHWLKALHATIKYQIPEGWKVAGENLYGSKTIFYDNLTDYFEVFNIFDEKRNALPLNDVLAWCVTLGLTHVPIIDILTIKGNDFSKVEELAKMAVKEGKEGIVIRNVDSFPFSEYTKNVAKYVRAGHVQPNAIHWMSQPTIPNKLK